MTLRSDTPRIRVVIPARYGSTRLPGKPLVELAGVPMIVRVYMRVRKALGEQAEIVVATDDERIAAVLDAHRIASLMTDPAHRSGTDRCAEVAQRLGWAPDDLVINVQGDEPLIAPALLAAFAGFCATDPQLHMATIATPVTERAHVHDPNIVKVIVDERGEAALFSRSPLPFCRDLPADEWPLSAFLRHVGIYAYRCAVIERLSRTSPCALEQWEKLEQLRAIWLGIPIRIMTWPEAPPPGVDTWDDVQRVSNLLKTSDGGL